MASEFKFPIPIYELPVVPNNPLVTEMLDTPSTYNSNLLIDVDVILKASDILYQRPVVRVAPSEPSCPVAGLSKKIAPVDLIDIWNIPLLASLNILVSLVGRAAKYMKKLILVPASLRVLFGV